MPTLHLSGTGRSALALDYSFMAVQSNGYSLRDTGGCAQVREQTKDTYLNTLEAARKGSRAPVIIGSHLDGWPCSANIDSLHNFAKEAKKKCPKVEFITFAELADWLDVQDPAVLKDIQALPPVNQ